MLVPLSWSMVHGVAEYGQHASIGCVLDVEQKRVPGHIGGDELDLLPATMGSSDADLPDRDIVTHRLFEIHVHVFGGIELVQRMRPREFCLSNLKNVS